VQYYATRQRFHNPSSYLKHPRIANEIEDYQDFHPLVMFTDFEPSLGGENPFTGNDRFVIYEDGGRPIDILLAQCGWLPTVGIVKRIAGQLLEVLSYLFSKRVVHRRLELGSVVFSLDTLDVKLISLGEAKYIEPLDYENRVSDFEREWLGARAQARGRGLSHPRTSSPPPKPHPDLSLTDSTMCTHPSLRCIAYARRRCRCNLASLFIRQNAGMERFLKQTLCSDHTPRPRLLSTTTGHTHPFTCCFHPSL
jgi:serine/threonine protein kinase